MYIFHVPLFVLYRYYDSLLKCPKDRGSIGYEASAANAASVHVQEITI